MRGIAGMVLLLLMVLSAPVAAWARQAPRGDVTVHTVGDSRVRGGDVSAAREEAIEAGLVAAVHQVLADLLPPETVAGNFQAINEGVLQHTERFVRDYRMLAQSTVSGRYRALVRATISADRIKEALRAAGIRLEARQYPAILFCIAESPVDTLAPRYWWDGRGGRDESVSGAALARIFAAEGYPVVRPAAAVAAGYPPELRGPQAVALGREFKAEVVVVGLATAETAPQTDTGTAPAVRGTITARAYRVADGQQIAQTQRAVSVSREEPRIGSREALDSAATQAAADLSSQIDNALTQMLAAGRPIEIVVHGITGRMADFVRFRSALGNLTGVDRLQIREMTGDAAILQVQYQGNARALAEALTQLPLDGFRVAIARTENDTIELQLVKR